MASNRPQDNPIHPHAQFPILTATQSHAFAAQQTHSRPLLPAPAPSSSAPSTLPLLPPPSAQQVYHQPRHRITTNTFPQQQPSHDPRSAAQSPTTTAMNPSALVPRSSPVVPHPHLQHQPHLPHPPQLQQVPNKPSSSAQQQSGPSIDEKIVEQVSEEVKTKLKESWTAACVSIRSALVVQGEKYQVQLAHYANAMANMQTQLGSISTELVQTRQQRDDAIKEKDRILVALSSAQAELETMRHSRDEYRQMASEIMDKWRSYTTTTEFNKERMEAELATLRGQLSSKTNLTDQQYVNDIRRSLIAEVEHEVDKKMKQATAHQADNNMEEARARIDQLEKELTRTRNQLEEKSYQLVTVFEPQPGPLQLATPGESEPEHTLGETKDIIVPATPPTSLADLTLALASPDSKAQPDSFAANPGSRTASPGPAPRASTKSRKVARPVDDDVEIIDLTTTPRAGPIELPASPMQATATKPTSSTSVTSPATKRALSPPPIAVLDTNDTSNEGQGHAFTDERPHKRSKLGKRPLTTVSELMSPISEQVSPQQDRVQLKVSEPGAPGPSRTFAIPVVLGAANATDWETGSTTTIPYVIDLALQLNKDRVNAFYDLADDMYSCRMCLYRNLPKTLISKSHGDANRYEAAINHWETVHAKAWRTVSGYDAHALEDLATKFLAAKAKRA